MSEIVERMAKAIYESKLLVQPREPWAGGKANVTEIFCMQAAKSALESIRDSGPTVGMMRALMPWAKETEESKLFAAKWALGSFNENFQAMIDAALKPDLVDAHSAG